MRYQADRACPLTGDTSGRVLGYIPAAVVAACNPTYKASFSEILSISPGDEFPIVESPGGFIFSGWLPPQDFLRRVYEDVIDHAKTVTQTLPYRVALLEFAAAFLATADRRHPELGKVRRLLDYGCGYGALLRMLDSRDVRAIGYEPSAARRTSASPGGFTISGSLDEIADAGPFDLFICTEVLEHLADPRAALRFMRNNAAPGALLGITVPNCERSYVNSSFENFAKNGWLSPVFNPWEHLNYFSAESLRRLLADEGFLVINDYGRTKAARDACTQFGVLPTNVLVNSLRVFKRAANSGPTTELFCKIL